MIRRLQEACWCHWRRPRPYSNSQFWLNCCNVRHKTSSSINYVSYVFTNTDILLIIDVVFLFNPTYSIFLTRQFSIESGTLVEKSTGKQVKTAGGNLLGVTLSEPSEEVTRELKDGVDRGERDLLTDATCFATTTMMHQTYLEYLTGTETVSRELSLLFHCSS